MSIIKKIKKLRYKSSFGFISALVLHKVYIFFKYKLFSDRFYISRDFKLSFGYDLDLVRPKTLSEKTQWYKLNYKNPLLVQCADKFAVRDYVAETIGEQYLIPLVFHTQDYKKIKPENLPDFPCIIKANHNSGTHCIVKDKSKVDWEKVRVDCRWLLQLNYYPMEKEWQYKNIKPRILVEKLLVDEQGQTAFDYKLFCMNGKVEFLQIDLDRFGDHKRNIYDKDWNLLPFTIGRIDEEGKPLLKNGGHVKRPENLEMLIGLAEKLAKPFPLVRVDFYILDNQFYFGELTFHSGGGYEHYTPSEWDLYFGNKVPLIKNF
jgi:hypothetical protein